MDQDPDDITYTAEETNEGEISKTDDLQGLSQEERRMASEHMPSLIIKSGIPTFLSIAATSLYNVIDRFWVGRIEDVGADALAGIGITLPLMNVIVALSMLIGFGATARISISLGARDVDRAERILGNALVLILIISAFVSVFGTIYAAPLLRLVGATDTIMPFAYDYFTIIAFGSVFSFVAFAMSHPIRGLGNAKYFAVTQVSGAVINMMLTPITIFVMGWGISGVAWSTVMSQAISCVLVFGYYFSKNSRLKIRRRNLRIDPKIALAITSIGVAPFVIQFAGSAIMAFSNSLLVAYGARDLGNEDIAVSAMAVIFGLYIMAFTPVIGMNQGAQPIIGFNYGAKNYTRMRDALKWVLIYSFAVMSVVCVLVMIFAPQMISMFNPDPELVSVGTTGLRIFFSSSVAIGLLIPMTTFFTSIGRAKMSIFLSTLRQVFMLLPMYNILPIFFGIWGVFMAVPVSDFISMLIIPIFVIREFRLLKVELNR